MTKSSFQGYYRTQKSTKKYQQKCHDVLDDNGDNDNDDDDDDDGGDVNNINDENSDDEDDDKFIIYLFSRPWLPT